MHLLCESRSPTGNALLYRSSLVSFSKVQGQPQLQRSGKKVKKTRREKASASHGLAFMLISAICCAGIKILGEIGDWIPDLVSTGGCAVELGLSRGWKDFSTRNCMAMRNRTLLSAMGIDLVGRECEG